MSILLHASQSLPVGIGADFFRHMTPEFAKASYQRSLERASSYSAIAPLNDYDRANILKLYYYQIAVCDYYAQYLDAAEDNIVHD